MIPALIIDDEENNRRVLQTLLKKHCKNISIVAEAGNADDAFVKINRLMPELVFLDINMPQKSGFDLLKMFSRIDFEVIFVTAHDNYALRAFEFNAIDYLIKPIDYMKLIHAVNKASERIYTSNHTDFILHFIKTISDKNDIVNRFSVHHNGRVIFLDVSEISFIQTKEENTTLYLSDNSHYHSSKDLVKFESILQETDNFIRINKSVIINMAFIKSYSKGENCTIDMKGGQSFEVSRRRKAEILKKLNGV